MEKLKQLIILVILVLIIIFISLSISPILGFYNSMVNDGLLISLEKYIDMKTLAVSIISLTALLVAVMNYLRKSGHDIEALLGLHRSNLNGDDYYFQLSVLLFNNKDRPIFITEAYIKLPNNIYISLGVNNEMCKSTDSRFILKPYEITSFITDKESKFMRNTIELIGIDNVIKKHIHTGYEIIVFTSHGEIKCKQLKHLKPKIARALDDKSIVIHNDVYSSQFFQQVDVSDKF